MRTLKNILVVLISIFPLPLVYFAGEWFELLWLRVLAIVLLIPYMAWWGFFGYDLFFGKKKAQKEDEEDEENTVE